VRGSQAANLSVGLDKLTTELVKSAKLGDFAFGFVDRGGRRQRFGDALAGDLVSEPEVRAMAGLAGLMTAAARLATSAGRARNRTRTKIAELSDLLHDIFPALLEISKGEGHVVASSS
jgi:hypothetical protein